MKQQMVARIFGVAKTVLWFAFIVAGLARPVPRALAAEGSDTIVRELLSDLQSGDKAAKRAASYRLSQFHPPAKDAVPALIDALDDQDDQVWFNSVTALARIGPDAADAIPALLKQLESSSRFRYSRQVWYRAAFALGSIGPAAFPALKEALASGRSHVRSGAAKAFSWNGPAAKDFIAPLAEKLGDEESDVREQAAEALGRIGEPSLEPLLHNLGSTEPETRQAAALGLEWLGNSDPPVVAALLAALSAESNPLAEAGFIRALSKLQCSSSEYVSALTARIRDESEEVRLEVSNALLLLEPPETTSVPALVNLFKGGDASVQGEAATLMGRIGPSASAAVPALIGARRNASEENIKRACRDALTRIGGAAVPALLEALTGSANSGVPPAWVAECLLEIGVEAVPALVELHRSGPLTAKKSALRVLRQIGPEAEAAIPELERACESSNLEQRALAIEALASIPAPAPTLLPIAQAALSETDTAVRRAGTIALAALEKAARPALPQLIEALKESDSVIASNAARAIGSMGPAAETAFPTLEERLREAPPPVRLEVVRALGGLGRTAAPAVPSLVRLLSERGSELQTAAAESLGKLGPVARESLPDIAEYLEHESASTRLAALYAYIQLEESRTRTLPILTNRLTDSDTSVRHFALESLEQLGRRAKPAESLLFGLLRNSADTAAALGALRAIRADDVELLTGALENTEWEVRQFAAGRLGEVGENAANAIPALRKLNEDENENVRRAARFAVRAIQRAASRSE